ncbi:MAG: hypothetical protein PUB21_07900 [Bacteroidales bacterium]|nr:hypothetical protein [Bacteroidales bacterium]
MRLWRDCGSEKFNTGVSNCPFQKRNIKAVILTTLNMVIKLDELETKLPELIHADRPDRVYPISNIAEYAPSGGEGQTGAVGYGPSKFTGFSPLVEVWSLEERYDGLFKNILRLGNDRMRVIYVDENNVIYAERYGEDSIRGVEMASIYAGGQQFPSSGATAGMTITFTYKDTKKSWMNMEAIESDADILDMCKGLLWVTVKNVEGSKYKILERDNANLDITDSYGPLLASQEAWNNVTAATYNSADQTLSLTPTSGQTPTLKSPAELYALSNPVKYIEQWVE